MRVAVPLGWIISRQEQVILMALPALFYLPAMYSCEVWHSEAAWYWKLRSKYVVLVYILGEPAIPTLQFATPTVSCVPVGFCPPWKQDLLAPWTALTLHSSVLDGFSTTTAHCLSSCWQRLVEVIDKSIHAKIRFWRQTLSLALSK